MKQQIFVFLLMVFLCQVFCYSKEFPQRGNNDSSIIKVQQLRVDSLAKGVQSLNERIAIQIEQQRTDSYITLLISFFAALAAIASAIATIKNVRISKLQKKIALFEKRFQIYDVIRKTMVGAEATQGDSLIKEILGFPTYITFLRGTMDIELLFRKNTCIEINEIQEILNKMNANAAKMDMAERLNNANQILNIHSDLEKLSSQIRNWTDRETPKLTILFKDYLEFRDP